MKNAGDTGGKARPGLSDMARLKRLNAQVATLQNLVQDYSHEMMPQWISSSTTTFCNLRCPHCQTHGTDEVSQTWNAKRWSNEQVESLAKEGLPYAFEFCLTLNGEPLTTPYLQQRLREFRKYGAKLHLTTNGTLLSKKTLSRVLPIASQISVSIDGATERTCNAIRLGAEFKKLVYNIKVMTRACDFFPWKDRVPDIRLAFTIMASNVRDMPEMVRLAHFLNARAVDFYDLVVYFPHVRDEDVKLHQPVYNAYRERTQSEADRLGVAVYMPEPFPGVAPDADSEVEGANRILAALPKSYYDDLPPVETLVDMDAIESDARAVAALMLAEETPNTGTAGDEGERVEAARSRLERSLETLRRRHRSTLAAHSRHRVPYCENLFKRTFVSAEGDVSPCCVPGRPDLGNVNESTLREIYNGEPYNAFRRQFFSSEPPECCVGSRFFISMPKKALLDVVG